jgi:hypothetical protein
VVPMESTALAGGITQALELLRGGGDGPAGNGPFGMPPQPEPPPPPPPIVPPTMPPPMPPAPMPAPGPWGMGTTG